MHSLSLSLSFSVPSLSHSLSLTLSFSLTLFFPLTFSHSLDVSLSVFLPRSLSLSLAGDEVAQSVEHVTPVEEVVGSKIFQRPPLTAVEYLISGILGIKKIISLTCIWLIFFWIFFTGKNRDYFANIIMFNAVDKQAYCILRNIIRRLTDCTGQQRIFDVKFYQYYLFKV